MLLPTAIEGSCETWAVEAGQFLGGQAPNLQDMHPEIEPPVYTLPSGAFALPLSVKRLRQLSSTAYLQQFLPPQPADIHAWTEDATLCACALELWSAIVDSSASRPALEALASTVIAAAGRTPVGDDRETSACARELVDSSIVQLHGARSALENAVDRYEHHISVIPAVAARTVGTGLASQCGEMGKAICDDIYLVEDIRQRAKFNVRFPLFHGELWHNWLSFDHPHVPAPLVEKIFRAVWGSLKEEGRN